MRLRRTAACALAAVFITAFPAAALAQAQAPAEKPGVSAEMLAKLDRVSDPQPSPDGRRVLYVVRSTDWAEDRGVNALWMADLTAADPAPRRLAVSAGGAAHPRWAPDGRSFYFLSARGGSSQVWRADADGVSAAQVTRSPVDVSAFRLSPDGRRLVFAAPVFADCPTLECTRDRLAEKAKTRSTVTVYEHLPVRPWDSWGDHRRSHLFALDLDGSGFAAGTPRALMPGFEGDTPARTFGDDSAFVFGPDGREVIFSAQKIEGASGAFDTNTDLWSVPVEAGAPPRNLTPDNPAADFAPALSPDGRRLAWLATSRPAISGDRARILVRDLATGGVREIAAGWDRSADTLAWAPDGRGLLVTAQDLGQVRLFHVDLARGAVRPLTGDGSVAGFKASGERVVYAWDDWTAPAQIFAAPLRGGEARRLTDHNREVLDGVSLGAAEQFTFTGWNGATVYGYVIKPANFDPSRRHPVAFLIHGGPKSAWTNTWRYRWNPQVYAAAGYAVVMIDFHGSTGYGQAFTDSITRHWGDRPLVDLQKGWAHALQAYPWLDADRACALGASYGGYMVNWIASQWNEPWRCLVNHAGVFDPRGLMTAMDLGWFASEFGGPPWEVPEEYARFDPSAHVNLWTKPMLVLHGGRDFRVPMEQGLATFQALQKRNIPSRFVHIPDENHWVLKPQNSVRWQEEITAWLDRWTAPR